MIAPSNPPLAITLLALLACLPSRQAHPRAFEEVTRGYQYLDQGDLERAQVAFDHALEFNPELPEALNGAGVVERRRGRLEPAQRLFERSVRLWPDFAEGHSNLGETLLALEHPAEAVEEFEAALRINPDMLDARLDLGRALLHQGRASPERRPELFARARRAYLHLLEARPDLAEAHHDLAYMDYLEQAYARAARSYRRAAEIAPGYVEALHGLCIALVRSGRCDEAAAECRRCLATAPGTSACQKSLRGALACASAGRDESETAERPE